MRNDANVDDFAGVTGHKTREHALAEFGRKALLSNDLDAIFQNACAHVASGLQVEIASSL
jgi:hypothetical protein